MYWFWWPITLLTVGTFTAVHLYCTARANGRTASSAVALGAGSVAALALVAIPLALAGHTPCSDEGADVISPHLLIVGALLIVWAIVLCGLYWSAGAEGGHDFVAPIATVVGTLVGLFFETFVAYLSLDNYCRTGSRNGLVAQLGAAVLVALIVGTITLFVRRLRPA